LKAEAIWKGRLAFTGKATSGFELQMDADASVGGDEAGFRPLELVAVGLAGCTAMDVISILKKKRQEITAFEVRVDAEQAPEHPMVFTRAVIEYLVTGRAVEEVAVARSIELSATRYCPVQGMLSKVMPIELRYAIFEESSTGEPVPVKRGVVAVARDLSRFT
jgi:putative redox protein